MPRVYDRKPRANDDHNPLKNLLNYQDADSYIQSAGDSVHQETVVKQRKGFANLFNRWFNRTDGQGTPDELDAMALDWRTHVDAQDVTLTEHTEAIATLNEIAVAVNTTAAYVSDLDDMATVPRINTCDSIIASGAAGRPKYQDIIVPQSVGGTNTVYQHFGVTLTFAPEVQTGSATTGHIYYTPIVVDRRGVVDKLRWVVGSDSSIFSIDYYEMALCVYNPGTGNIEKVWGSGNIKDAEANVGSAFSPPAEAVITMLDGSGNPLGQQCQPGQILFVAHQQVAPGAFQSSRRMSAAATPRHDRTVPLLDAWCYVAPSYTEGIPSSISLASLDRENRFLPWEAVSVNALEPV